MDFEKSTGRELRITTLLLSIKCKKLLLTSYVYIHIMVMYNFFRQISLMKGWENKK